MDSLPPCAVAELIGFTDHHTAARAAMTCKTVCGGVGRAAGLPFPHPAKDKSRGIFRRGSRGPPEHCLETELNRDGVVNWLWEVHSHKQLLDPPRVLVHRAVAVMDAFFMKYCAAGVHCFDSDPWTRTRSKSCGVRRIKRCCAQQVACAAMAEALSRWLAPPSSCSFMRQVLGSIGGSVAAAGGFAAEGDYWTCLLAGISGTSDRLCTVSNISKMRSFLRVQYCDLFTQETAFCRIKRLAVALDLSVRARVAATLLCDLTLTLSLNGEWNWAQDVRIAACLLVAFVITDCDSSSQALVASELNGALRIVKALDWPPQIRTCATRWIINLIGGYQLCDDPRMKLIGVADRLVTGDWKVDYKIKSHCWIQDQVTPRCYHEDEVAGLVASLQEVDLSNDHRAFSELTSREQHATIWSSFQDMTTDDWSAVARKLEPVFLREELRRVMKKRSRGRWTVKPPQRLSIFG